MINRYLIRRLSHNVGLTMAVICGILWLSQTIRFSDLVIFRNVSFLDFMYFTICYFPYLFILALPISAFIGVLMSLHRLNLDYEIIIFRTMGMGDTAIAKPVMFFAAILAGGLVLLQLYLAPVAFREFKKLEFAFAHQTLEKYIRPGDFQTVGDLTVYVERSDNAMSFDNILIYDGRIPHQPTTMMARKAFVVKEGNATQLIMMNGYRYQKNAGQQSFSTLRFDRYALDITRKQALSEGHKLNPAERFIHELFFDEDASEAMTKRMFAEGHQRLMSPLYMLLLVMIALVTVLKGPFKRNTPSQYLFFGTLLALFVELVYFCMGSLIVRYNVVAAAGYIMPLLGMLYCYKLLNSWKGLMR